MSNNPMSSSLRSYTPAAAVLGVLMFSGLGILGYQVAHGIVEIKQMDRSVEVKGLSEREVAADIAIWPISYNVADNDLSNLYRMLQDKNAKVVAFLADRGFKTEEISTSAPSVVDKQAREYNDGAAAPYRYTATSTITVYSNQVDRVRETMTHIADLGKQGIPIAGDAYSTQFVYSKLNDIKPAMIEEATRNARETAAKFAKDSDSRLGKIKRASQGTFSIENRDSGTAYIKKVRVVSTVEYYLSD